MSDFLFGAQRNSPIAPEGSTCWICLDEGPDEKGGPLMRNCACRGEGSGFAHASCVGKYLFLKYTKGSNGTEEDGEDTCINCNQPYLGDMALAVAMAQLDTCMTQGIPHTSQTYVGAKLNVAGCQDKFGECRDALETLVECHDLVRSNPAMRHLVRDRLEFEILKRMGIVQLKHSSQLNAEQGMICLKKAMRIAKRVGYHDDVKKLQPIFDYYEHGSGHGSDSLKIMRAAVEGRIQKFGKTHEITISGFHGLADALRQEGYITKALTTAKQTLKDAQSALGPSHPVTTELEKFTNALDDRNRSRYKAYAVDLISDNKDINGKVAVVLRPAKGVDGKYIVEYSVEREAKRFKARIDQLLLCENLPVTCHGLVNAAHLNERTGRVVSYNEEVKRYKIRFSDKDIKNCLVRPENLTITF